MKGNGVRRPSVLLIGELVVGAVGKAAVIVEFTEYGGMVVNEVVVELKSGPAVVETLVVLYVPVRRSLVDEIGEVGVELLVTGTLVLKIGVGLNVG